PAPAPAQAPPQPRAATPEGSGGGLALGLGVGGALVVGAGAAALLFRRRSAPKAPAPAPLAFEPELHASTTTTFPTGAYDSAPAPAAATTPHRPPLFGAPSAQQPSPFEQFTSAALAAPTAPTGPRAPRPAASRAVAPAPAREPEPEIAPVPATEPERPAPVPVQRTAVSVSAAVGAATAARAAASHPVAPARTRPRGGDARPAAAPAGVPYTYHVEFGDDLVEVTLAGHPAPHDTAVAWMPVPYDVPGTGAAFVCIGSSDASGCLFLDLAQAPGPVVLEGDAAAGHRLMESLVLQLSASPVLEQAACATAVGALGSLTDGMVGMETAGSLRELAARREQEIDPPFEFVFCTVATEADEAALDDLLAGPGRVVPVVLGTAAEAPWRLAVHPAA
ncbi:hypothetical protein ABT160_36640, partial [Streptomyces sp. NPDC001941]